MLTRNAVEYLGTSEIQTPLYSSHAAVVPYCICLQEVPPYSITLQLHCIFFSRFLGCRIICCDRLWATGSLDSCRLLSTVYFFLASWGVAVADLEM